MTVFKRILAQGHNCRNFRFKTVNFFTVYLNRNWCLFIVCANATENASGVGFESHRVGFEPMIRTHINTALQLKHWATD